MCEVKIIESPRDAMQGLSTFIPTKDKARYINALLKVGYHTIDFGSFVSPKAIPQMRDTADVLKLLDLSDTKSKLLAIVPNRKGGEIAAGYDEINYLGYPFSISPTFLRRNINSTIEKSQKTVGELLDICERKDKTLVVYISMAFGNPYGDEWSGDLVANWVNTLYEMGVRIIQLSDTVGISSRKNIGCLFSALVPEFRDVEFGLHLHTTIRHWFKKIDAAFQGGCRRFDTVINGLGGCPMAENRLVGNLRTSNLLEYLEVNNIKVDIDEVAFEKAYETALEVFKLN